MRDLTKDDDLFAVVDGLYAWDQGCLDSGIHDPELRKAVHERWHDLADEGCRPSQEYSDTFSIKVMTMLNKHFCEAQIKNGYGFEDLKHFVAWFDDFLQENM